MSGSNATDIVPKPRVCPVQCRQEGADSVLWTVKASGLCYHSTKKTKTVEFSIKGCLIFIYLCYPLLLKKYIQIKEKKHRRPLYMSEAF